MTGRLALLAWLEVRHLRSDLRFVFFAAGTDIEGEQGLMERAYQLYVVAFFGVVAVLSWGQVLSLVAGFRGALGVALSGALATAAFPLVPAGALLALGLAGLRETPLCLSGPDIAWLARVVRPEELLCVRLLKSALAAIVVGALAGALVGELAAAGSVMPWAVSLSIVTLLARTAAFLPGLARAAVPKRRRLAATVALALVLVLAAAALAWVALVGIFVLGTLLAPLAAALSLAFAAIACGVSRHVDMAFVVEDSELFAVRRSMRFLASADAGAYREACRRGRLGRRRRPLRTRGFMRGRGALVSHAVTSLLRRPADALGLLSWGALGVPVGAALMVARPSVGVLLSWLLATGYSLREPLELTYVFREDCRNRLVRSMLPFGRLELLLLDSLPALVLSALASGVVTWLVAAALGESPVVAAALSVLLDVVLVLSAGFDDPLRAGARGTRPLRASGPSAALAALVVVSAGSLVSPVVALACAALLAFGYASRLLHEGLPSLATRSCGPTLPAEARPSRGGRGSRGSRSSAP